MRGFGLTLLLLSSSPIKLVVLSTRVNKIILCNEKESLFSTIV